MRSSRLLANHLTCFSVCRKTARALALLGVLFLGVDEDHDRFEDLLVHGIVRGLFQGLGEALPGEALGLKGEEPHRKRRTIAQGEARLKSAPTRACPRFDSTMRPQLALLLLGPLTVACVTSDSRAARSPKNPTSARTADDRQDAQARPWNAGFLIVDGVYNSELTAPFDILHHTVFHTEPGMRVFTVAPTLGAVTSFEGLRIVPNYTYENAPPIDVLVVPSAEHSMDSDLEDEALLDFVRRAGAKARYVVSLCDGAFVLAAAGLLDGKRATTFPSDIARMTDMFPAVCVLDGPSFVHDGKAITSVGGAKSFDPALYLCELLYGERTAIGLAGGLVIDWDLDELEYAAFEGELH